jgi:hypothetical protein
VYTDTIGEFGISAILGAGLKQKSEAVAAATGWLGDRVAVFKVSETERVVSWKTRWESERDAEEFAQAYSRFIEARYSITASPEGKYSTPHKTLRISRSEKDVSIVFWISL